MTIIARRSRHFGGMRYVLNRLDVDPPTVTTTSCDRIFRQPGTISRWSVVQECRVLLKR